MFAVPVICRPLAAQQIDLCATWYKHLSDLDLADHSADDSPMAVDLLIGLDFYWDLVTGKVRRGESGPAAIHTRFGWVLSGVTPLPRSPNTSHSFLTTHVLKISSSQTPKESLEDILHSFWRLESLGIESTGETVLEGFVQSNCFKDGRYEVRLPWKEPHPPLPDNYKLSHRRLESLLHRLKHDPAVQQEYMTPSSRPKSNRE